MSAFYNSGTFILGYGKTHKDAASVRATHPIPSACGLYYFEVKIVSKGRDGYDDLCTVFRKIPLHTHFYGPGIWELVSQPRE